MMRNSKVVSKTFICNNIKMSTINILKNNFFVHARNLIPNFNLQYIKFDDNNIY